MTTTGNQTGKPLSAETFVAWANIVLEIWMEGLMKHKVMNTGALWNSLIQHVVAQADGSTARIDFFFLYYGIYVDIGTGKEFSRGNSGDIGASKPTGYKPKRIPKPWYSKAFYGQTKRLAEIIAQKVADRSAASVVGFMAADQLFLAATNKKSVRAGILSMIEKQTQQSGSDF